MHKPSSNPSSIQRQVFVLRLWRSAQGDHWLSQLHHVASGQTHAFADPDALLSHIRGRLQEHEHEQPGLK